MSATNLLSLVVLVSSAAKSPRCETTFSSEHEVHRLDKRDISLASQFWVSSGMKVEGIVGVCDLLVSSPSLSAAIYYFLPQQCHLGQRGCVFCNDLVLYCLGPFTVKILGVNFEDSCEESLSLYINVPTTQVQLYQGHF